MNWLRKEKITTFHNFWWNKIILLGIYPHYILCYAQTQFLWNFPIIMACNMKRDIHIYYHEPNIFESNFLGNLILVHEVTDIKLEWHLFSFQMVILKGFILQLLYACNKLKLTDWERKRLPIVNFLMKQDHFTRYIHILHFVLCPNTVFVELSYNYGVEYEPWYTYILSWTKYLRIQLLGKLSTSTCIYRYQIRMTI